MNASMPAIVGCRLARQRIIRGWVLRDVQAKTGLNASTIMRIEHGQNATFASVAVLASVYSLSLDALVAESTCRICDGAPPPGFTCRECGADGLEVTV